MEIDVERQFDVLLEEAASVLSQRELDEIAHFVRVNEFGLALETALDIFREEKKTPGPCIQRLLEDIALSIGVQRGFVRSRLRASS